MIGILSAILGAIGVAISSSKLCLLPLGLGLTFGVIGLFTSDKKAVSVSGILTSIAGILVMCQFAGFVKPFELNKFLNKDANQVQEESLEGESSEDNAEDSQKEYSGPVIGLENEDVSYDSEAAGQAGEETTQEGEEKTQADEENGESSAQEEEVIPTAVPRVDMDYVAPEEADGNNSESGEGELLN